MDKEKIRPPVVIDIPEGTKVSVYREGHFDSAHSLDGYRGKCANIHGHRWTWRVYITADKLDSLGMIIDFSELKRFMTVVVENVFDHKLLNEVVNFNPTAEQLAITIYNWLKIRVEKNGCKVERVEVFESPECCAIIRGEKE